MELHPATLWEALSDAVPSRLAQVQGGRRSTWSEFDDRSARLAGAFRAAGVGAGAKVGQLLYNCPEYMESYAAALKLRAVPFNVNYRYTAAEVGYLLANADTEALVYHASLGPVVAEAVRHAPGLRLLVEVDDGPAAGVPGAVAYEATIAGADPAPRIARSADDVTMIYTGGTTGMPKGVVSKVGPQLEYLLEIVPGLLGHAPVLVDDVPAWAAALGSPDDWLVSLPAPPLMHNTGLGIGALPALGTGGTIVLLEGRKFDAAALWDTVEAERVNAITIVGDAFGRPMATALRDGPRRDLGFVRSIASSGAMFSTEVKTGLLEHATNAMIIDIIAASEGTMGMSISTAAAPAATGRFQPAPGVIVVSDDDREVEPGSEEAGMVALPGGAEGYYKDEAKTAATFREIAGRRYTIPGDWATVDADGTIVLLGRGSSVINTAGEKVYPEEVEETLKAHAAVVDALVFGIADERFGQRVAAVIALTGLDAASTDDILETARTKIASYKVPRAVVVVDEVPRTQVGKPDYPTARELFDAAGDAAG
jgi:fatty-acyl-CoA synthase